MRDEVTQELKDWLFGEEGCTCHMYSVDDHFERHLDKYCPLHGSGWGLDA